MPLPRCPAPPVPCAPCLPFPARLLFSWRNRNCRSTAIGRRTDPAVTSRLKRGADSLDDRDGRANAGFDVEIGIIQNVSFGGRLQGGRRAIPVTLVAPENIGPHQLIVCR